VAVGLAKDEGKTPREKDRKIKNVYPWGTQWPPPKGAGNYDQSLKVDDYHYTSPVGLFAANEFELYDMGGNVREWCEDLWDGKNASRVLRGGSWRLHVPDYLVSSYRLNRHPDLRGSRIGFRCVVGERLRP
jgi:formylglycine-generating enzyme required for sulfatase activity